MKHFECKFEAEVLAAVVEGSWPQSADDELRAHVRSCEICSDAVAVAVPLTAVREADRSLAVTNSGLVWWRAQLRMRREAAEAAERPIIAAQWVAFVCAALLLVSWIASSVTGLELSTLFARHELLIIAMAALLLSVPAVVYLALGKE